MADLKQFPKEVTLEIGHSLREAQDGKNASNAKPLKGFHGASVLEIIENHDGNTYRAVYTVRFKEAVYVLHCFQKKSKSGIATPKQELHLVEQRLNEAIEIHKEWAEQQKKKK